MSPAFTIGAHPSAEVLSRLVGLDGTSEPVPLGADHAPWARKPLKLTRLKQLEVTRATLRRVKSLKRDAPVFIPEDVVSTGTIRGAIARYSAEFHETRCWYTTTYVVDGVPGTIVARHI